MLNPPKIMFHLTKPTVNSRYRHRKEGMLRAGIAKITISNKIDDTLMRLTQYWSWISLKTPRPLALLATRRCHRALAIRGVPRMRLVMQTTNRMTLRSVKSGPMEWSTTGPEFGSLAISLLSRWTFSVRRW